MQTRFNTQGRFSGVPSFEVFVTQNFYGVERQMWYDWFGASILIERNCHDFYNLSARTDKMSQIFIDVFGTDFFFNEDLEQIRYKLIKVIKHMNYKPLYGGKIKIAE